MNSEITKKLLKIVVLILLVSFSLDKIVFFALNKISDEVMTGQAIGKLNHFLSLKDETNFLVFGNSRANHHINVNLFDDKAYNMGVDGIGIAYSSTLINTLEKEKKQLILVHIDTKNFFDKEYKGSDIRGLITKYKRDLKITKAIDHSGQLPGLQHFFYSMNYNRNAIGIVKNFLKPSYDHTAYNGYDPLAVSSSQQAMRDTILSKNLIDENCSTYDSTNPVALNYLKSILSFINKSPNKTYIFLTSPLYNDTCKTDNIILNEIMQDLGLTYWDFSDLYQTNKDNSYWKDLTHMSKKGAEAFSKHLREKYEKEIDRL